jgi:hypothetical protein
VVSPVGLLRESGLSRENVTLKETIFDIAACPIGTTAT